MVEQTNIETAVSAIVVSPNVEHDGICFAARTSGLVRSEDAGATWHNAYESLNLQEPLNTSAVAVSPSFIHDCTVFAGVVGGVLRSADGGRTWRAMSLSTPPPFVSTLTISPNFERDGMVFAGTLEDGVFCSKDRGESWSPWNFGLLDLNVLALVVSPDFASDETLFVGTESGIFGSTNGGRAWREVDFPMDFAPVLCLGLSPNYRVDGVVFAGTESCGLFRSNDRGQAWTRIGDDAITDCVNSILLSPEYPAMPDLLVMLGETLLVSRDDGHTWTPWRADFNADTGLSAVAAPRGLDSGSPLWVGLMDGSIQQL